MKTQKKINKANQTVVLNLYYFYSICAIWNTLKDDKNFEKKIEIYNFKIYINRVKHKNKIQAILVYWINTKIYNYFYSLLSFFLLLLVYNIFSVTIIINKIVYNLQIILKFYLNHLLKML